MWQLREGRDPGCVPQALTHSHEGIHRDHPLPRGTGSEQGMCSGRGCYKVRVLHLSLFTQIAWVGYLAGGNHSPNGVFWRDGCLKEEPNLRETVPAF